MTEMLKMISKLGMFTNTLLKRVVDIFVKPIVKRKVKIKVYKDLVSAFNVRDVTLQDVTTTLNAFFAHEDWISSKFKKDHAVYDIVNLYNVILQNQGGEIYNIFRTELLFLVMKKLSYEVIYTELWNILEEVSRNSPIETEKFYRMYNSDRNGFIQRLNAWSKLTIIAESDMNINDKTRFILDNYKDYYEISSTYFKLARLWELKKYGKYNDSPFSKEYFMKKVHLVKGRVINEYFRRAYISTAFHGILISAYDVKLRNMCGHNSYEVIENGRIISSLKEKYSISYENLLKKLNMLIHINNALYWIVERGTYYSKLSSFADRGVIAVGFANSKFSTVFLFQLAIFEKIDNSKKWLNIIEFEIENDNVHVYVSKDKYPIIIPYSETFKKWHKSNRTKENIVVIFPVIPPLGISGKLITLNGFKYEIIGDIKIKYVKIGNIIS